jgi:hypothetical protein
MDIYRDYFTREALVRVLAQSPYTPTILGAAGIFEPVPLNSTVMAIEEQAKDAGKVLTAIARGAPRQQTGLDKRKVHTFGVQTFGDEGVVYADEVLNSRGAGTSGAVEILQNRRDRLVEKLRRDMDYTHESLRMAALLAPGTTEFGSRGTTQTIALATDATKTRAEIFTKIIKPVETALDGETYSSINVYCSDGFWEALIENKSIKDTYLNWQAAADLRGGLIQPFRWGDVNWIRYRGTSAVGITADKAVAVPAGVQGFAFTGFAPNDTLESVGQGALGQPYYLGGKVLSDSQGTKGWEVSIQSHPRCVVARPGATFEIGL